MRQVDYNRAEEYITLRDELLQLQGFARQILYWTVLLIVAGFGWYVSRPSGDRIPAFVLGWFFYLLIFLSAGAYLIYMNQVYRIGSYLAVFWESRDLDRWMKWHRFNRRGPVGGFLPDTAVFVYAGTTAFVVFFLAFLTIADRPQHYVAFNISAMLFGLALAICFPMLRSYLRNQRDRYEREWRVIRGTSAQQVAIHDEYETIPVNALS